MENDFQFQYMDSALRCVAAGLGTGQTAGLCAGRGSRACRALAGGALGLACLLSSGEGAAAEKNAGPAVAGDRTDASGSSGDESSREPQIAKPQLEQAVEPELPPALALGTARHVVTMHLTVEKDGSVSEVQIVESQGEALDLVALRAARELRFQPALVDGQPVRARVGYAMLLGGAPSESQAPESSKPMGGSPGLEPSPKRRVDSSEQIEVVVTGARVPERAETSVSRTQVLTRRDLRLTGATTVGGALEAQPGLLVRDTFRGTELWIRGLDPEYTLVLVDGQRVPGRIGGAVDLTRYPLENIERIEVVRGPTSALYGSEAIGGTVNLITRESEEPLAANAEARLYDDDGYAGSARVAARPLARFGTSLSAGRVHTPEFRRDPRTEATSGSARTLSSVGSSVSFDGSGPSRARLSADYTHTELEGVDEGAGGAIFDRQQVQEQALIALNHQLEIRRKGSQKLHLRNLAQYSQFRDQFLSDQRGSAALDQLQVNREQQGQLTTLAASTWNSRHRTTVGGELLAQVLESERLLDRGHRARYAVFAEHRWVVAQRPAQPGNVEPGDRQKVEDSGRGQRQLVTVVPGLRLDVDSQFGSQLSPKLATRWDALEDLVVRAGYGRGFRAPSFQELLLRFENPSVGYVVDGNPELDAESSHSIDLSADYRPSESWFLSLAGFGNFLDDMIATIEAQSGTATGTTFSYANIDRAWTAGVESLAIWSPWEALALTAGYTFLRTRDEALDRPLSGRPEHRLLGRWVSSFPGIGVTFSARASVELQRRYFLDQDGDGADEEIVAEPLARVDVRLAKSFNDRFELFVGGDNLADTGDQFAQLLPRRFYAGLRGEL